MFKRRRFPVEIILVCVRWYCKYGISYRDLTEMMLERGVEVDPSTIMRTGSTGSRRRRGSQVNRKRHGVAAFKASRAEAWAAALPAEGGPVQTALKRSSGVRAFSQSDFELIRRNRRKAGSGSRVSSLARLRLKIPLKETASSPQSGSHGSWRMPCASVS